ncbi:MAG: hypothetical protein HEQ39_04675 [Rhizobacter sp.]
MQRNPDFLQQVSLHVELHVARGDLPEASRIAARHASWLKLSTSDHSQLHYLRAIHVLFDALRVVPARASAWRTKLLEALEGEYGAEPEGASIEERQNALAARIEDRGLTLSAAFDQRNGNDFFMRAWRARPFTAVL